MSGSKLRLYGIGTALFRSHGTVPLLPFLSFKPIPFPPPCRASSSAAETLPSVDHPWPEWVSFVDRLNTKGYLPKSSPSDYAASLYTNMNSLKDACLSFARDRYDLFQLMPMNDIQTVVQGGCPNLLRKAVNSAKRLRAYLQLDEGEVCCACNLRSSCDRAYVILKDLETDARTVDIVRIILLYALDPLVLSGGDKSPSREIIESSARKLLSQLIELSELSPTPPPAPSRSKTTAQDPVAESQPLRVTTNQLSKDVEMKRGDWMCPKCNFMNFSRNMQCLNCKEDRPKDLPTIQMKQGDWTCPECNFLNFARNTRCLKCKTEGPSKEAKANTNEVERKKGDWTCPQCGFMNYARNTKCLRCPELRPKKNPGDWNCPECGFMNFASKTKCLHCQVPNPSSKKYHGDWSCPKCDFYNYAKNVACLKCNTERPKEQPTIGYEDHEWRQSN